MPLAVSSGCDAGQGSIAVVQSPGGVKERARTPRPNDTAHPLTAAPERHVRLLAPAASSLTTRERRSAGGCSDRLNFDQPRRLGGRCALDEVGNRCRAYLGGGSQAAGTGSPANQAVIPGLCSSPIV